MNSRSQGAKVPRVRKFQGAKVLGTFAALEQKFHGRKVPREPKFSLWTFYYQERKFSGRKSQSFCWTSTVGGKGQVTLRLFADNNQWLSHATRHYHKGTHEAVISHTSRIVTIDTWLLQITNRICYVELCHRQWPWLTFSIISVAVVSQINLSVGCDATEL